MTENPTILVQNLFKNFGPTRAIDGLSLQVSAGEIYGLVGPDGAGKTTTLRLLCGALLPSTPDDELETRLEIGGYDVVRQPEDVRSLIGYLPQRFSMYEELTVLENLRFFAEVRGLQSEAWQPRCLEILSFVGLEAFTGRLAGQLSGGMKQKLGLAAALVHQPDILLLDEPTTGVDPVTRQDFWQLIIRLVGEGGTTVLVSTPYMDEAVRCQRVGFMQAGRLMREGTPDVLRQALAGRILEVRGRSLAAIRDLARQDPSIQDAHLFGDRLHLRVGKGQAAQTIRRFKRSIRQAGLEASAVREVQPQLEDTFMALMDEEA
jgi:ABC-2 type transport system ATP-binding protein